MTNKYVTAAKPLLLSKTFWGVIIMALSSIFPKIALVDSDMVTVSVNNLFELLGGGFAIYGRVTAKAPISGFSSTTPVVIEPVQDLDATPIAPDSPVAVADEQDRVDAAIVGDNEPDGGDASVGDVVEGVGWKLHPLTDESSSRGVGDYVGGSIAGVALKADRTPIVAIVCLTIVAVSSMSVSVIRTITKRRGY